MYIQLALGSISQCNWPISGGVLETSVVARAGDDLLCPSLLYLLGHSLQLTCDTCTAGTATGSGVAPPAGAAAHSQLTLHRPPPPPPPPPPPSPSPVSVSDATVAAATDQRSHRRAVFSASVPGFSHRLSYCRPSIAAAVGSPCWCCYHYRLSGYWLPAPLFKAKYALSRQLSRVTPSSYTAVCFSPPQKTANTVPLHTYQRMFFASAIAATDKWPFFRPKRRKQAFIGSRNKRPSSAVLLPDAVARWRGRRALPQSPFGRHEVNIAEKRLPSAIPITGRRFTHVFGQCIVCCIAFRLLYRIIVICSRFCWCILYWFWTVWAIFTAPKNC